MFPPRLERFAVIMQLRPCVIYNIQDPERKQKMAIPNPTNIKELGEFQIKQGENIK